MTTSVATATAAEPPSKTGKDAANATNQVRETAGWHTNRIDSGLNESAHTVDFTMPTGHTYRSQAPDPP